MKKLLGFALLLALVAVPASADSALAVNAGAALNSTNFGLQVTVDNVAPGNISAYVVSQHPVNETHYLCRFWIKPLAGFSLAQTANANFIRIMTGVKDPGAGVMMVVFLKKSVVNGNYRVNVWLKNDSGAFFNAGEFFLTSSVTPVAQQIEFEYTAGTSNNGRLIARKNGSVQFDTGAVNATDTWPLGEIRLGFVQNAQDLAVANGPIAIDEFESYR